MRSSPLLLALLVLGFALPATADAQGVDLTCSLALTKTDPATVNVAYPDEGAIYWIAPYQAVPGTRLRITGRYPHARYMSFNVYDVAARPIDALADVEIVPDAGSSNPFAVGADRTSAARDYTAFVDFGPIPERRALNTLYTGTGQTSAPNLTGLLILRVYIPDATRDETGGVGLPTVVMEPVAGAGGRPPDSACRDIAKPAVPLIQPTYASMPGLPAPPQVTAPGKPDVGWVKFRNLVQAYKRFATDNPFLDDAGPLLEPAEAAGGEGGFLSNIHNSYVYAFVNRAYGEVSITRMRAPAVPDTRQGRGVMPDAPLRYFSMCTNDFVTQRFVGCATDDQTTIGDDGFAEYVVSTAPTRPLWATRDCGYTWLPNGPGRDSTLVLRHMLPREDFAEAIQRAKLGAEAASMGSFLPTTRYLRDAETPPCRAPRVSSGPSMGLPASTTPGRCTSRRRFTIRLDRRLRSAVVSVAGRKVAVRRGRRMRSAVDLRGLPQGTFRVRIVGRDARGRRIESLRTYRTCGA